MTVKLALNTVEGPFTAYYSATGLVRLDFPADARPAPTGEIQTTPSGPRMRAWHKITSRALNDALAGRSPRELPPLDLSAGTDFQRRVWAALRRISTGRTQSYGEVAAEIGKPAAMRAVGGACGANPIPIFVPCHRVLAANRGLGGFTSGLAWKRKLLAREGIAVE